MNLLRQVLARCWEYLRRSKHDQDDDPESTIPTEAALLDDTRRWAEERKHFWAEFHEGQRQAEERSRV